MSAAAIGSRALQAFEDPRGGSRGVCASASGRHHLAADVRWLLSELECATLCLQADSCTAYEYAHIQTDHRGYNRCELQREPTARALRVSGFVCRVKIPRGDRAVSTLSKTSLKNLVSRATPVEPWDYLTLGPPRGQLDVRKCDALLRNPEDHLWHLFRHAHCLGTGSDRRRFFEDILSGHDCDANWISHSAGASGRQDARPLTGPALLGYDSHIYKKCMAERGVREPPPWRNADFQQIVDACLLAQFNVIRVFDWWNACRNLEWQMCVILGKLPGQPAFNGTVKNFQRGEIRFATAPSNLVIEQLRHPPEIAVDIFFLETCFFSHLCINRQELFHTKVDEPFYCELDIAAYKELDRLLPPG
uniref:Apple domain-containing protein n=2 Tax=Coccolithus braarudii TaxID=221442 RepID=A0A7S0PW40_9EUKA|mmetsp:Transcript_18548/g.39958  ORF Transcript_18548/g.39958 Transcript_18548/m.39958 type:complete len:362 (+) Transcript_18548:109-1194(+)